MGKSSAVYTRRKYAPGFLFLLNSNERGQRYFCTTYLYSTHCEIWPGFVEWALQDGPGGLALDRL